jgi:drug/metabolite transporter (DMT)-like permease
MAPFIYIQIIAATVMGVLVFGYCPNDISWLGMGVIISFGALSASSLAARVAQRT